MASLPYGVALLLSGLILMALAGYGWRHRTVKGALAFSVLALAGAVYSIAYAGELTSTSLEQMLMWVRVEYIGLVLLCPCWLLMVLSFLGKGSWLTQSSRMVLFAIPATTLILVATNDLHGLYFAATSVYTGGPFPLLSFDGGPWYWVDSCYAAFCVVVSSVLLLEHYRNAPTVYRKASLVMLSASAITWLSSLAHLLGVGPHGVDLTPFGMTIAGPLLLAGLVRFKVLELIPVARELVFDEMSSGAVILNAQARIVDANTVACSLLDVRLSQIIGRQMNAITDLVPSARTIATDSPDGATLLSLPGPTEKRVELRQTPIGGPEGETVGTVVFLRDVTAQAVAEAALIEREQLYRTLVENMQDVVWKTDANMILTYVSPTGTLNTGCEPDEIVGHSVWENLPPASAEIVRQSISEWQQQSGNGWPTSHRTMTVRQTRDDGSTIWKEITFRPIHDDSGKIVGYQGVTRDVSSRMAAEEALRQSHDRMAYMATHDHLTDLANRTLFSNRLEEAMARVDSTRSALAVLMIDLDRFKTVNDTLGHSMGDEVLKLVAKRLLATVRSSDTVCRFAGDEFLVLLDGVADLSVARKIADKILRKISTPMKLRGQVIRIGCSIGIALYPEQALTADDLVQKADRAMYFAKQNQDHINAMGEASAPLLFPGQVSGETRWSPRSTG